MGFPMHNQSLDTGSETAIPSCCPFAADNSVVTFRSRLRLLAFFDTFSLLAKALQHAIDCLELDLSTSIAPFYVDFDAALKQPFTDAVFKNGSMKAFH